jgi:hypothetical protein
MPEAARPAGTPLWFPFDRAEARRAFMQVFPLEHVETLLADIYEGDASGGAITEPMLILLALQSEAAAARVLAMRPDLADLVSRAFSDPANVHAVFDEFATDSD